MSRCEYYRSGGACGRTGIRGRCDWLTSQNSCPDFKTEATEGDLLKEANAIINGERQDSYGKPEDSFSIIAEFWSTYLTNRSGVPMALTAKDSAIMMSLFKHARMLGQKPSRDNPRDACGYLAIYADRLMKGGENG